MTMTRQRGAWLLYALIAAVMLGLAQRLATRGVPTAITRRMVHAAAGLSPLIIVPLAAERRAALLPYLVTVGGNTLLMRSGGLEGLDIRRRDWGIVYLPLAQVALLAWGWPARWAAVRAALVALALGDSAAALVGERWGAHRYRVAGTTRSFEGSATLLTVATLGAWLSTGRVGASLAAGGAATLAEALSPHGTDNLTIPLAVAVVLRHCVEDDSGAS